MNTGKTLFAQLMDFLPWTTFTRIVDRYGGDHRVRTLSCAEQYRSMAFAQLTYRESLRDIETCLSVHASKLYHMGFRQPVRRSTLADANERRDWRIHAALAQRLITQARTLYVDEELGLDLTNTVYQPVEKGVIDRVSRHGEAYRGEGGFAILGDDEDDLNDQDGSSGRNKHEQGANSARHGLLRGAGADELAHQQR